MVRDRGSFPPPCLSTPKSHVLAQRTDSSPIRDYVSRQSLVSHFTAWLRVPRTPRSPFHLRQFPQRRDVPDTLEILLHGSLRTGVDLGPELSDSELSIYEIVGVWRSRESEKDSWWLRPFFEEADRLYKTSTTVRYLLPDHRCTGYKSGTRGTPDRVRGVLVSSP